MAEKDRGYLMGRMLAVLSEFILSECIFEVNEKLDEMQAIIVEGKKEVDQIISEHATFAFNISKNEQIFNEEQKEKEVEIDEEISGDKH